MAANGERTVVSLKKYNQLESENKLLQEKLDECGRKINELNGDLKTYMAMDDLYDLHPYLKWFMMEMRDSLNWNEPIKGETWKMCLPAHFMGKINMKIDELYDANAKGGELRDAKMIRICTDIANYCMMLADNTRRRNETPF